MSEVQSEKVKTPVWVYAAGALLGAVMLKSCGEARVDQPPRQFGHIEALSMCQLALQSVAKDPDKADIPYVDNLGSGDEYYYAWGAQTKMARMRNGLGLDVAASASCIVDGKSKRITSLTVNGQTII